MPFTPKFLATAIGSMPHTDPEQALDIVLANLAEAPIWPQLPKRSLTEQMEPQYTEGMPRARIDPIKNRLYFDTTGDTSEELAAFYEAYIAAMDPDEGNGDCSAMAISPDYAAGLHGLEARLKAAGRKYPYVKVQTTGPISFALAVTDQDKRALYYNDEFRDMLVKALAMKCRWQIQKFAPYAERVICFIDEPILSAFGSSTYVSVTREDIVSSIAEVVDAIHADNGLAGMHCCGNTEWSIPVDAGVDIVNLDGFEFGETIALYPAAVNQLFARNGALAWGVVPSSAKVRDYDVPKLVDLFDKLADKLAAAGVDKKRIFTQAMITSSCGAGALEPADAELMFQRIAGLGAALREKYGH